MQATEPAAAGAADLRALAEALGRLAPETDQDRLDQIAELSRSAMSVWYGLLGLVIFGAVLLMGHQDADFFAFGVETTLPLIGLEAPTEIVFLGVPLALLALYAYLHASLLKLARALAEAPERVVSAGRIERDLDEAVHPFLFSDAMLRWRSDRFHRPLNRATAFAAWAFGWALAPALIAAFWVRSMPAHDEGLTLLIGAALWLAMVIGWMSRGLARRIMRVRAVSLARRLIAPIFALVSFVAIGLASWATTEAGLLAGTGLDGFEETELEANCRPHSLGDGLRCLWLDFRKNGDAALLYPAQLRAARITAPPPDFPARRLAVAELQRAFVLEQTERYGPDWRQRLQGEEGGWEGAMRRETDLARAAQLSGVGARDLSGADLRRANLFNATLGAAQLDQARLDAADLHGAWMEGASLEGARLRQATLDRARMENVRLYQADLTDASLQGARLDGAYLADATLDEANFAYARLSFSDMFAARMIGASFQEAEMEHVAFGSNAIYGCSFAGARLTAASGFGAYALRENFGDGATILPAGMTKPADWPGEAKRFNAHVEAWEAWRKAYEARKAAGN